MEEILTGILLHKQTSPVGRARVFHSLSEDQRNESIEGLKGERGKGGRREKRKEGEEKEMGRGGGNSR